MDWDLVTDGIDFGEAPRWREGRLWFSDFYQRTVSSIGDDLVRRVELEHTERPSGLGWLPDGRLLVVSMTDRRVLRREHDGTIALHADLSGSAGGHCNDMVVASDGTAYVGNFGFDLDAGAPVEATTMIVVHPDGRAEVDDHPVFFPNGSVIVDGLLVVGETFAERFTAFRIGDDGSLSDPRVWASVPGTAPDGCTIDAEGAIWYSDALGGRVVRVRGGEGDGVITDTVPTPDRTFACMLGGEDGCTLFALTCAHHEPELCAGSATGSLWARRVDVPRHPTAAP